MDPSPNSEYATLQRGLHKSYEELNFYRENERKNNLAILLQDKEINKLKNQLYELEQQVKVNKAAYGRNNEWPVMMHPLVNDEFKFIRQQMIEVHDKLNSATLENQFKKAGDSSSTPLSTQLKYLEKEAHSSAAEVSESRIEALKAEFEKQRTSSTELEHRLIESRKLVKHLESELSEILDTVSSLNTRIRDINEQNESLKQEINKQKKH
jgi:chromosome segregation ATPase